MKVVHVIVGLNLGGAEQMLKRLLQSDLTFVNDTVIVSLTDLGKIGQSLRDVGFTVHVLNMRTSVSFPCTLFRLTKFIRQHKPDIVQTWMYHSDLLGGLASRLAGCKRVVWGIRNTYVPIGRPVTYAIMKLCALLSYFVPNKIVCVAEASRDSHTRYGYCSSKMRVISNGFEFDAFDSAVPRQNKSREQLGLDGSSTIIGCVGRFHADKGQDVFVRAAAILYKRSENVRFMLVGRDCDSANEQLMSSIRSLGLESLFLLLGERDDISDCLAAIDLFCQPSRTEGFPNSLGEAMAMALPCVATAVGDTKVLTADTARLVTPDDPAALATALSEVLALSREDRQAMGKRAAHRVRSEFSIDKARERFNSLYQELMEVEQ